MKPKPKPNPNRLRARVVATVVTAVALSSVIAPAATASHTARHLDTKSQVASRDAIVLSEAARDRIIRAYAQEHGALTRARREIRAAGLPWAVRRVLVANTWHDQTSLEWEFLAASDGVTARHLDTVGDRDRVRAVLRRYRPERYGAYLRMLRTADAVHDAATALQPHVRPGSRAAADAADAVWQAEAIRDGASHVHATGTLMWYQMYLDGARDCLAAAEARAAAAGVPAP